MKGYKIAGSIYRVTGLVYFFIGITFVDSFFDYSTTSMLFFVGGGLIIVGVKKLAFSHFFGE